MVPHGQSPGCRLVGRCLFRCPEYEQSALWTPRSPLGFRVRPDTHRTCPGSPAHRPRASTTPSARSPAPRSLRGRRRTHASSIRASRASASTSTSELDAAVVNHFAWSGLRSVRSALPATLLRTRTASLGSNSHLLVGCVIALCTAASRARDRSSASSCCSGATTMASEPGNTVASWLVASQRT